MIHERRLDTARGRFRCLDAGAGWPVVLIHAFPLTADMWRPQLEGVAQGWRYVAPDLRGFGASPATMDDYAADVEAIMDTLEIETAVVGGLSMGGYVTFAFHRRASERLSGVGLADTKAEADTPEGRDKRLAMSALVRSSGSRAVADKMLPTLLSDTSRADAALLTHVRALIESNQPEGIDHAIHVIEILSAAARSASTGQAVEISQTWDVDHLAAHPA